MTKVEEPGWKEIGENAYIAYLESITEDQRNAPVGSTDGSRR